MTFLFKFKMGCKETDSSQHQKIHLAQELLMNVWHSGGSRSFTNEVRGLKVRSSVVSYWSWQWPISKIIEAGPLTTTWEVAKKKKKRTQHWLFCGYSAFEANWKYEKPR